MKLIFCSKSVNVYAAIFYCDKHDKFLAPSIGQAARDVRQYGLVWATHVEFYVVVQTKMIFRCQLCSGGRSALARHSQRSQTTRTRTRLRSRFSVRSVLRSRWIVSYEWKNCPENGSRRSGNRRLGRRYKKKSEAPFSRRVMSVFLSCLTNGLFLQAKLAATSVHGAPSGRASWYPGDC
ncbi:hypothetical protein EVAR_103540_1 [Eumeta japonica]|uniref:Uncharacterized protein n=1 Tax=Eumeta variegata TaxID=151549 RepID=A0A4C1YJZ0_EUMVA|nr:hypothetical protein EVAR_103540_1 [Eumeta japonica]